MTMMMMSWYTLVAVVFTTPDYGITVTYTCIIQVRCVTEQRDVCAPPVLAFTLSKKVSEVNCIRRL